LGEKSKKQVDLVGKTKASERFPLKTALSHPEMGSDVPVFFSAHASSNPSQTQINLQEHCSHKSKKNQRIRRLGEKINKQVELVGGNKSIREIPIEDFVDHTPKWVLMSLSCSRHLPQQIPLK
jgi:hypothetical protein